MKPNSTHTIGIEASISNAHCFCGEMSEESTPQMKNMPNLQLIPVNATAAIL